MVNKNKNWDKKSMIDAVKAVREGKMGYKRAVQAYKVPRSTLKISV